MRISPADARQRRAHGQAAISKLALGRGESVYSGAEKPPCRRDGRKQRMILRVFRARLKPGARQAFEQLCYDVSIPLMRAQPGLVTLHVGKPLPDHPDEFVLVSVWKDLDGLIEVLDANFLGWSRAMAPAIMGNPGRPELGDTLVSSFCRTDPDIAREWARVVFLSDHRVDVPHCTTRTLVLQTAEDVIAPVAVGEWMNAHLPHSEYRLMAATGHCPHMSAPEETAGAMRDFLMQDARQ